MIWWIIVIALILHFFFDVHYFIRIIYTYLYARFLRSKTKFLESSEVFGICLPSDADFMITHMNNSRYLREYDFARFDFMARNRTMDDIMRRGGNFPVAAMSIRYRLPLMMFSRYKVVTTPIWWDEKNLYLDQRVITLSDKIVRTVGYTKVAMVKVNFVQIVEKLHPGTKIPEMPVDLKKWIEANDLSSEKMKK